ncbi:MAG: radical SAM protein [Mariniphaga sp.]|nr:radical SAM protein [Mariniphaga sp.]
MKRVDIKTGFLCNNNCRFCVQADNKCKGNRSFDDISNDLIDSRKRCIGVVFTGGEVTIRDDFFDLIKLAKELNYEEIQIQTNGRMFASLDFCKKTIEAGANVFGLALHGYCSDQHDFLTKANGSFNQTVRGIINLRRLGQIVGTNTVIVKSNYLDCSKIAKLLVKLKVNQFQFAFVHPMGNAWNNFDSVVPPISEAAPFIHKGLDVGIKAGVKCMAEAIPYCFMVGYESCIVENRIPETEIRGLKHQNIDDFLKQKRIYGKSKFPQCVDCKGDKFCEGPWSEYSEKMGFSEFKALK